VVIFTDSDPSELVVRSMFPPEEVVVVVAAAEGGGIVAVGNDIGVPIAVGRPAVAVGGRPSPVIDAKAGGALGAGSSPPSTISGSSLNVTVMVLYWFAISPVESR